MKAIIKHPAFWAIVIVVIAFSYYGYRKAKRKRVIRLIEERFGSIGGLQEKTTEELEQILNAK